MREQETPGEAEVEKYDPVDNLRKLRFEYSDEIPQQIIRRGAEVQNFKAKKSWWKEVVRALESLMESNLVSSGTVEQVKAFERKFCSRAFDERPTTPEDIAEANALIEAILAEAENRTPEG